MCAEFRIGRATILVATDVAARGLGEQFVSYHYFTLLCRHPSQYSVGVVVVVVVDIVARNAADIISCTDKLTIVFNSFSNM